MTENEYDVALSFAGEDRAYVEEVARCLRLLGLKVFYDKYEEVNLWGKNLYTHLDEVYRFKSKYCVIFISEFYKQKLWTNHERESAQARAFDSNSEYILPVRFDETEIPGVRPTTGYLNLKHKTPHELADLIAQKLGIDTSLTRTIAFRNQRLYNELSFEDVSHANAKRYSVNILMKAITNKNDVIKAIKELTQDLKQREFYRDSFVKNKWQNHPAHVVWIFAYLSLEDVNNANWICRSQWVDSSLDAKFTPSLIEGEDIGDGIIIDWKNDYIQRAEIYDSWVVTKEYYVEKMLFILNSSQHLAQKAIALTSQYKNLALNETEYLRLMREIEKPVMDLSIESGKIGVPPIECKDLNSRFRAFMVCAYNIVLPTSDRGLETWPKDNRDFLIPSAIEDYQKELERLNFELHKLNLR